MAYHRLCFVATLLISSLPTLARELCTPDEQLTLCEWEQIANCKLLDEQMLNSPFFTAEEKKLIGTVRQQTLGKRKLDVQSLTKVLGTAPSRNAFMPNMNMAAWVVQNPQASPGTTAGFVFDDQGVIQVASVSVPRKFVMRWCTKVTQ